MEKGEDFFRAQIHGSIILHRIRASPPIGYRKRPPIIAAASVEKRPKHVSPGGIWICPVGVSGRRSIRIVSSVWRAPSLFKSTPVPFPPAISDRPAWHHIVSCASYRRSNPGGTPGSATEVDSRPSPGGTPRHRQTEPSDTISFQAQEIQKYILRLSCLKPAATTARPHSVFVC